MSREVTCSDLNFRRPLAAFEVDYGEAKVEEAGRPVRRLIQLFTREVLMAWTTLPVEVIRNGQILDICLRKSQWEFPDTLDKG